MFIELLPHLKNNIKITNIKNIIIVEFIIYTLKKTAPEETYTSYTYSVYDRKIENKLLTLHAKTIISKHTFLLRNVEQGSLIKALVLWRGGGLKGNI